MKKAIAVFSSILCLTVLTMSVPALAASPDPALKQPRAMSYDDPAAASVLSGSSGYFGTELIVRTVENFKNAKDVTTFMQHAQDTHVSVISVLAKQDEDDEVPSGNVFYNSRIAPIASGYKSFDALAAVVREAHSRGIKVKAWVPQFHDRAAINKNSAWQMMAAVKGKAVAYTGENKEYFASPLNPDCQAYERSIIREIVSNYDVDGVVLDWIRFDDYNMDVGAYARNAFMKSSGIDPLKIDYTTENAKRTAWQDWRTSKLANYIADVKNDVKSLKPGVRLGVYVLPLEFVECGQNASKFAGSIDFISPMAYYDDWDYPENWVYNSCIATAVKAVNGKTVIPTFDADWTSAAYHDIYSNIRTMYPDCKTFSFFEYGKWDLNTMKKLDKMRSW